MLQTGTYSLGEDYALVIESKSRYVTASISNRPNDTSTEIVRREARKRWNVAVTLGPWREAGVNAWKAVVVTCITGRR